MSGPEEVSTKRERTPKENADAIFEALCRENPKLGRDRYRIILAVLEGAEMREETCRQCHGRGKITVTCESSGGTFYNETRKCPGSWDDGCDGTGKIRRLQFNTRVRAEA